MKGRFILLLLLPGLNLLSCRTAKFEKVEGSYELEHVHEDRTVQNISLRLNEDGTFLFSEGWFVPSWDYSGRWRFVTNDSINLETYRKRSFEQAFDDDTSAYKWTAILLGKGKIKMPRVVFNRYTILTPSDGILKKRKEKKEKKKETDAMSWPDAMKEEP